MDLQVCPEGQTAPVQIKDLKRRAVGVLHSGTGRVRRGDNVFEQLPIPPIASPSKTPLSAASPEVYFHIEGTIQTGSCLILHIGDVIMNVL